MNSNLNDEEDDMEISENEDIDFSRNLVPEASALLNIIKSSPSKNRSFRYSFAKAKEKISELEDEERTDVLIA